MNGLRSDDHAYSPRGAIEAIIERVQAVMPPSELVVQWQDGEHVRFQHEGNIARLMMLGDNLAIADGDSGMPAPLALDGEITEYNVATAVEQLVQWLQARRI